MTVEHIPTGKRCPRISPGALVRPTHAGLQAQAVWRPLTETIETRWGERFGMDQLNQLKESLQAVVSQLDPNLPDGLPTLGYGLFTKAATPAPAASGGRALTGLAIHPLPALLSKVLMSLAIEFEDESEVSLAISANVLRLAVEQTAEQTLRVRDIPNLAGVSKEAVAMSLSFLEKQGYATVQPARPASRMRVIDLTTNGQEARKLYWHLTSEIERRWQTRFDKGPLSCPHPRFGLLRQLVRRYVC